MRFLEGENPGYPMKALRADTETVRQRVAAMRADRSVDHERPSDYTHRFNPAVTGALVQLMLGGNDPGRSGNVLLSRLFYYDPERSRPGLPEQVGALVDRIGPSDVRVRLVNLDPLEPKRVVVQAGAYGQHRFGTVRSDDGALGVNAERFEVLLEPGSGGTLEISMQTYANRPRFRSIP